jgi:hypothetical protein
LPFILKGGAVCLDVSKLGVEALEVLLGVGQV